MDELVLRPAWTNEPAALEGVEPAGKLTGLRVWRQRAERLAYDELAAKIAEVPASRLSVIKQAVNSWAEEAGARTAALRGADYHAIYHQVSEWGR